MTSKTRFLLGVGLPALVVGALAGDLLRSQTPPADLVLTNGSVITVDARDSVAQAVAVRAGKIVFVGPNAGAKAFIGDKTEVIDLRGRTATPGLIDTHVHFSEPADNLDLGDARNMADVIAKVKAWADRLQPVNGCAAAVGTRANWPNAGTSRPPISTKRRRTIPCT
jgi:predicted amidohydrolase YtcJ